ncbi:MAG TPA: glycosyltransferase [Dermatophilaceae bacterium]|jgi:type III pantothenate kinase|nr:glycosyltransferase [Dermatophilaceae bacterium]
MKIAMVSEHASPLAVLGGEDAGGQNVHVAALATHLAARGHSVVVYTRRDAPETELAERVPLTAGVTVVHVPVGPAQPIPKDEMFPLMDGFGDWLAEDWRRSGAPDIVHAHFWMSGLAALRASQQTGVPTVQTFHALGSVKRRHQGDADTSPEPRVALERGITDRVDAVIATCTDEVAELEAMGARTDHVSVVPCGVDTSLFTPGSERFAPASEARHVLLTVGRLVERKGYDCGIRALPYLPNTGLVIVGGPPAEQLDRDPEARRLRAIAEECGVADRVHLVGAVAHEQLPQLYRCADVVLSTPWYEPFGITPVEAAACGRPVVASAVGGLIDTVRDGETGRLVPPRDPQALAEAVAPLLADPQLARRWGQRAHRRAVAEYDWSKIAQRTEEVLENTLGAHRRARATTSATSASAGGASAAWLRDHQRDLRTGLSSLVAQSDLIERWGQRLALTLESGGRLLAAGNGGSAAEAQHLTAELVGRFDGERIPLSAICLSAETSSLTAILNDYGAEEVFARQVAAHGRPGDVLVLLSTSGRSRNLLAAARAARERGVPVWAMTGRAPNPLCDAADEALVVEADSTAAVQEVHLVAVHTLCVALEAAMTSCDGASGEQASDPTSAVSA